MPHGSSLESYFIKMLYAIYRMLCTGNNVPVLLVLVPSCFCFVSTLSKRMQTHLHSLFLEKRENCIRTEQDVVFLLKQRPLAKFQLIWSKREKYSPNSHLGWLYPQYFNTPYCVMLNDHFKLTCILLTFR